MPERHGSMALSPIEKALEQAIDALDQAAGADGAVEDLKQASGELFFGNDTTIDSA